MSDEAANRETNNNKMQRANHPDSSRDPISCESVQVLLVEYLMNELEDEPRQRVEGHLDDGCPQCKQQWQHLKTGKGLLLRAIPERELSQELRDKILASAVAARVDCGVPVRTPQVTEVLASGRKPAGRRRLESALLGLAMLACGVMLAPFIAGPRQDGASKIDVASNPPPEEIRVQADAPFGETPRLERSSRRPIAFVAGSADAVYLSMRGEAIFDYAAMQVHFFGSDFPPPPPGKDYVLWLQYQPDGPTHPAQTLQLSGDGRCKAIVNLAENDCYRVFITLEGNGGMPTSPTGERPLLLLQAS